MHCRMPSIPRCMKNTASNEVLFIAGIAVADIISPDISDDVKSGLYRNAWAGIQQYNNHKTNSMLGKDKSDNKGKLVSPIPYT